MQRLASPGVGAAVKVNALRALVRPLVTLAFTGALIYGFLVGIVPADSFLAISGGAILFWFTARTEEKREN